MKRLFSGIEAEGRFKGIKTLFVAGDVPEHRIRTYMDDSDGQIYFGADNKSAINYDTVGEICLEPDVARGKTIVTLEVSKPIPSILWKRNNRLYVIVPVQDQPQLKEILDSVMGWERRVQIKFDTSDRTYCTDYARFWSNDFGYKNTDVEIWKENDPTPESR